MNLRAIGIILIATIASVLALAKGDDISAALGILGAIAGYLFGTKATESHSQPTNSSEVNATGASIGSGARIAGRDINETINNLQAKIENISDLIGKQSVVLNRTLHRNAYEPTRLEYLINTIYQRGEPGVYQAMGHVIQHWSEQGYTLVSTVENYDQADAIALIFSRPLAADEEGYGDVLLYRGNQLDHRGSVAR